MLQIISEGEDEQERERERATAGGWGGRGREGVGGLRGIERGRDRLRGR